MQVLIVEDDESIRQIFRYMFRGTGHDVIYTEHLTEAADKLKDLKECALLITDYKLPEGLCVDFAREFRAKFPRAGLLVVTGAHGIEDELRTLDGLDHANVLHKPFDMDDTIKIIELALKAYGEKSRP
jgi:DNA-binding NtrC family response regulator